MTDVVYDYLEAAFKGEGRHATIVMKELGIRWKGFRAEPVIESVIFFKCEDVPAVLPTYIRIRAPKEEQA